MFNDRIASFTIIDCRFDYEYAGGHIPGAININTTLDIEEKLLGQLANKPTPSCSGDALKKNVLVFHCEFSAKRAPTL
jgi:M-phase inducer tyrosine phosphatase